MVALQISRILPIQQATHTQMQANSSETCYLAALANVASQHLVVADTTPQHLEVALPESPLKHITCSLRAIRKRLNMTQREFGCLLSPGGVAPISPSVVCQLESALQAVSHQVIARASAVDEAIYHFGAYLASREGSAFTDAAHALKCLGPGCIGQLDMYVLEQLGPGDAVLVGEFLAIVTKRKPTSGGSRPGARGPYRKLSKLDHSVDAVVDADATGISPKLDTERSGFTQNATCSLLSSLSLSGSSLASTTPRSEVSSSIGSSRPRSPLGSVISSEAASSSVDSTLLNALKRLQEENDKLQSENKRLRAIVNPC